MAHQPQIKQSGHDQGYQVDTINRMVSIHNERIDDGRQGQKYEPQHENDQRAIGALQVRREEKQTDEGNSGKQSRQQDEKARH